HDREEQPFHRKEESGFTSTPSGEANGGSPGMGPPPLFSAVPASRLSRLPAASSRHAPAATGLALERKVVVLGEAASFEIVVSSLVRRLARRGGLPRLAEIRSTLAGAPEHHHVPGADLGDVFRHPVLVLVGAIFDLPFHVHPIPLLE